jgi:uncharacterized protein (DUF58 family)
MAGVWGWLRRILKPGMTGASAASTKPVMMSSPSAPAGATVQVSRRYPLSSIFVMYCLVSLLVAVGAFKDNNNLLYWLFGLSMGMLIVSGIISGTMMMAVTARRLKLDDGQVGQPLRVRYEVTNISRWWPVFALQVREGTGDDDLLAQTKRSLWDRLRRSRKGVQVQPATSTEDEAQPARLRRALRGFIVHIPPRSTMVFEAITVPSARGRLTLDEFELGTGFPFGIIRKALVFTQPASTIIRPESVEVPAALFAPRQGRAGFGDRSSRAVRSGEDLFSVREYTPGDPASTIWWRATARAGDGQTTGPQMTVRQFSSGVTQRVWLQLSLGEDPSIQAGSERVLSRACSIIAEAHRRSLAVGMLLEQAGLKRLVQPRVGQGTAASLMNDLSLHRLDRSLVGGVRGEVAGRGSNRAEQIHDIPAREGDIIITLGFEHPEQITLSSPGSRNSSLGPGSSTRDLVAAATNKAEGAL